MMEQYLKMADGSILKNSYARESQYGLYVYILDAEYNMVSAFSLLTNTEAVREITYHYYKAELVFDGYTKLVSIQSEGDRIIAMLTKEKDVSGNGND